MGFSGALIIGPLAILFLAVILGTGSTSTIGTTPLSALCGSGGVLQCTSGPTSSTFTCPVGQGGCTLPYTCPASLPPFTLCSLAGLWVLQAGHSVVIPNSLVSSLGPANINTGGGTASNYVFGPVTVGGFIGMIVVATSVVIIGAVTFFGTGAFNDETAHIVWITTLLLGIWGFLTLADGYPTSPTSFFVQLDALGAINSHLGTISYFFLSAMYCLGIVSTVSRGGSGGAGV